MWRARLERSSEQYWPVSQGLRYPSNAKPHEALNASLSTPETERITLVPRRRNYRSLGDLAITATTGSPCKMPPWSA